MQLGQFRPHGLQRISGYNFRHHCLRGLIRRNIERRRFNGFLVHELFLLGRMGRDGRLRRYDRRSDSENNYFVTLIVTGAPL